MKSYVGIKIALLIMMAGAVECTYAKTWIIEDGVFGGVGRTISGTFDFDATTLTYSNLNIVVSNSAIDYDDSNPSIFVAGTTGGSGGPIDASHLSIIGTGPNFVTYQLFLSFESALTNDATESINLIPGTATFLGVPGSANVGSYEVAEFLGVDNIAAGRVTPVPLGNGVVLLILALGSILSKFRTNRFTAQQSA